MFLLVYLCGTHFSECVPIYMNFIIFCIFKGKSMTFFRNCITFIDRFYILKFYLDEHFACMYMYTTLGPSVLRPF